MCTKLTLDDVVIRAMTAHDLPDVLTIENATQLVPWSKALFEEALGNHSYYCRVVEHKQQVVAFHIISSILDETHVLTLATAVELQGCGLGHILMDDIVKQANKNDSEKIFLEVRQSNRTAQALYLKWQFKQISVRKNYYRLPNNQAVTEKEDALIFVRLCPN